MKTNATINNNANEVKNEVKTRSLKCLANDAAKVEFYSLKQATNAVKNAYDEDKESKDTRAYIASLGFSAKTFKMLTWQELQEFATTKSGKFSTWAVLNALKKYSDAHDLLGIKAAKAAKAAERAAAKAAAERIKAAQAEKRAAAKAKADKLNKEAAGSKETATHKAARKAANADAKAA